MTEHETLHPESNRRDPEAGDRRKPRWAQPRYSLIAFIVGLIVVGFGGFIANQVATNARVRHDLVNECERVKSVKIATNVISGIARFTSTNASTSAKRFKIKVTPAQAKLQREYASLVGVIPTLPIVDCEQIVDNPDDYTSEGFLKSHTAEIAAYRLQVKQANKFLNSKEAKRPVQGP
jgi:hypothetical protein